MNLFLFEFIYLFLRESTVGEGQRKRRRERIPSRLCTASAKPNSGLKPTNYEIMIWAEVRCLTGWATQVHHDFVFLFIIKQINYVTKAIFENNAPLIRFDKHIIKKTSWLCMLSQCLQCCPGKIGIGNWLTGFQSYRWLGRARLGKPGTLVNFGDAEERKSLKFLGTTWELWCRIAWLWF